MKKFLFLCLLVGCTKAPVAADAPEVPKDAALEQVALPTDASAADEPGDAASGAVDATVVDAAPVPADVSLAVDATKP